MEEKNPYSGMSMEEVDFDKVREMWMEQKLAGKPFLADGNLVRNVWDDAAIERFNAMRNQAANTVEEKKPYSEMSVEELEDALKGAENAANLDKRILNKTGWFTAEYSARKAGYNASLEEVNTIKSEIFKKIRKHHFPD